VLAQASKKAGAGGGCARAPPDPVPTTEIDRPDIPLYYVANVYFKCFRCFRDMLQLFHMDVAKVD
jgi:hypothetical protein